MQASTFKLKTNLLSGGRSHTPLAKSGALTMGLNFYTVGRKNKLHTHPGEDHAFVVIEGQATFYDKDNNPIVLNKGEGIMLPDGYYYYFESTGSMPLAILRSSAARKDRPAVLRVDVKGDKRMEEEEGFVAAGKLFIDYCLSEEGQTVLKGLSRITVRQDVLPNPPKLIQGHKLLVVNSVGPEDYNRYNNEYHKYFR